MVGRARAASHQVIIDQREYWLTDRSFGIMLALAVASKCSDSGWATPKELDLGYDPETVYTPIFRLKQSLSRQGLPDPDALIENNKRKRYRLSTPPRNVEIDESAVTTNYPEGRNSILRLRGCLAEAES